MYVESTELLNEYLHNIIRESFASDRLWMKRANILC